MAKPFRRWWWLVVLLPTLAVAVAPAVAFVLFPDLPGSRTRIDFSGAATYSYRPGKLVVSPELSAENIDFEFRGITDSAERFLLFRREVSEAHFFVMPGNLPVYRSSIRYALIDKTGAEISTGSLPDTTLAPRHIANGWAIVTIGDFELRRAETIILSKSDNCK
jgi:hypothetical protein